MNGIDDERYLIRCDVKQKKAFHFDQKTELDMFAKIMLQIYCENYNALPFWPSPIHLIQQNIFY